MNRDRARDTFWRLCEEVVPRKDGWRVAEAGGISLTGGTMPEALLKRFGRNRDHYQASLQVDRDACTIDGARALALELEARFDRADPAGPPLVVYLVPTTRMDAAMEIVRDHFDSCASRDEEQLEHHGEAWARLGAVALTRGWRPAEDRIRVEMWAESSTGEYPAQRIAEAWLAELAQRAPEVAAHVEVVGLSH